MRAITISKNRRFLVTHNHSPFFPLGDTAFEMLYRLNREEIDFYLTTRAAQRFNLVTINIFNILQRLDWPSSEGELPLVDCDPMRPNEAFFDQLDFVVGRAEALGIHIGLLPFTPSGDENVGIFSDANARAYGRFLGRRYQTRRIVWILGGNFSLDTEGRRSTWRSMAQGLRDGVGQTPIITFLPPQLTSSSEELHEEDWLSFNTVQTCHSARDLPTYDFIAADYARAPAKPTWEIEYSWENGGVNWDPASGRYDAYDVRKGAYWSLFAGGFGCMYGSYDVFRFGRGVDETDEYQFATAGEPWKEALMQPGAIQMGYVRSLMESRPFLTRIPDQGLLISEPGAGVDHVRATRDDQGRYAFVYAATGQPLSIDSSPLGGDRLIAWWFDPRSGTSDRIGEFPSDGRLDFVPPSSGHGQDWVLVVDDATQEWPAPGTTQ